MSILNSNNFLYKTVDDVKQFFSPLVNASTVVLKDGSRLEKDGKIYVDQAANADNATTSINADNAYSLGGIVAADYALKSDLGVSMELLWENQNPNSKFTAQTITLNKSLSQYKWVYIIFNSSIEAQGNYCTMMFNVGFNYGDVGFHNIYDAIPIKRSINITTGNTIVFGKGKYYSSGWNDSADGNFAVPYLIYGIKGDIS